MATRDVVEARLELLSEVRAKCTFTAPLPPSLSREACHQREVFVRKDPRQEWIPTNTKIPTDTEKYPFVRFTKGKTSTGSSLQMSPNVIFLTKHQVDHDDSFFLVHEPGVTRPYMDGKSVVYCNTARCRQVVVNAPVQGEVQTPEEILATAPGDVLKDAINRLFQRELAVAKSDLAVAVRIQPPQWTETPDTLTKIEQFSSPLSIVGFVLGIDEGSVTAEVPGPGRPTILSAPGISTGGRKESEGDALQLHPGDGRAEFTMTSASSTHRCSGGAHATSTGTVALHNGRMGEAGWQTHWVAKGWNANDQDFTGVTLHHAQGLLQGELGGWCADSVVTHYKWSSGVWGQWKATQHTVAGLVRVWEVHVCWNANLGTALTSPHVLEVWRKLVVPDLESSGIDGWQTVTDKYAPTAGRGTDLLVAQAEAGTAWAQFQDQYKNWAGYSVI